MVDIPARYDRQVRLISPENQARIAAARVAVVGSGPLADFTLADLLCFGVKGIRHVGESEAFEFDKMNPGVAFEQTGDQLVTMQHADMYLEDVDVIVDASNDSRSYHFSSTFGFMKRKPCISGTATRNGFTLAKDMFGERLLAFNAKAYGVRQGAAYSMICGAMIADEVRKVLAPLKNDIPITQYAHDGPEEVRRLEARVLQVGAGAIGTFSAIALVAAGVDLTVVDFDSIEESNLNRQFLFYDAIGKSKAEVLAERLGGRLTPRKEKIGADFDPSGYDVVFSCVDNNEARYHMNEACKRTRVRLYNGGSSELAGHAMPYIPGKTACLDCQSRGVLSRSVGEKKEREGNCFQPSLVVPNQVVAGMMMLTVADSLQGVYEKSNFSSGLGIASQPVLSGCEHG